MAVTLPKNFTLAGLNLPRKEAELFCRRVIKVLYVARKEQGEVRVRFGVTGTGQAPNYRIEDSSERPLFAVDGATHEPWREGEQFTGTATWSTVSMSFEDVEKAIAAFSAKY